MKTKSTLIFIRLAALLPLLTFNSQLSTLFAQGTAFTYQGRLSDNGAPANGSYDLRFYLRDAVVNGNPVGTTNTLAPVAVSNGVFTLVLDFGGSPFATGANRWLEIGVRTNGGVGAYSTLVPRQPITATPYAITAANLTGVLPASQLSGTLASGLLSGTYSGAIIFNNAGNSFTGNGSGLTGLNASQLSGGTVPAAALGNAWKTTGNAGTTPGANFAGTTDNQALELKVNSQRALRLEPNATSPNFVAGFNGNYASNTVAGATVGGGGATASTNRVLGDFGTVGGGQQNTALTRATVGGGIGNTAIGGQSTIGGGEGNTASATTATVGGGYHNNATAFRANVSGGELNTSSGASATIAGGDNNNASGFAAAIGGGEFNSASGTDSTVPGGIHNTATNYAFAAGRQAKALHDGTFVWSDSRGADFASTGNDQFLIRAGGGVGIGTANPATVLDIAGTNIITGFSDGIVNIGNSVGAHLTLDNNEIHAKFGPVSDDLYVNESGGNVFIASHNLSVVSGRVGIGTNMPQQKLHVIGNILATGTITGSSDRNAKENFTTVDPREVLDKVTALPISRWNYKADTGVIHLGPMAQDFYAAFAVGMDDRHISMVDADGVALAAIQGLNEKLEVRSQKSEVRTRMLEEQLQQRETEITELKQRLEALEKIIRDRKN